jgi:hypothetical protein
MTIILTRLTIVSSCVRDAQCRETKGESNGLHFSGAQLSLSTLTSTTPGAASQLEKDNAGRDFHVPKKRIQVGLVPAPTWLSYLNRTATRPLKSLGKPTCVPLKTDSKL